MICIAKIIYFLPFVNRVTDAWHHWASQVQEFNRAIRARDPTAPPGYEQLWAVGIDACVVCNALRWQ